MLAMAVRAQDAAPIPIAADNLTRLTQTGTLGRGNPTLHEWSPDGRWLLAISIVGLWLFDAHELTAPPTLIPLDDQLPLFAQFAPDMRTIGVVSCLDQEFHQGVGIFCTVVHNQILMLPDLKTIAEETVVDVNQVYDGAYNGAHLLTVYNTGRVQRLTPDGMSVQIADLGQGLRDAAISSAGDQVAFTDGRTLRMWDVREAAEVWQVSYRHSLLWASGKYHLMGLH